MKINEIKRLRAALFAAQNWFMKAGSGKSGDDFLNDGGWEAADDVAAIIDKALGESKATS